MKMSTGSSMNTLEGVLFVATDVTMFTKLEVDSDLTETAIEIAMELLGSSRQCRYTLICSHGDAVMAGRLAAKHGFSVIVLPGILDDYWALCGDYFGVYSPGA